MREVSVFYQAENANVDQGLFKDVSPHILNRRLSTRGDLGENLGIGAVFTMISLIRSFALRRAFNALAARSADT